MPLVRESRGDPILLNAAIDRLKGRKADARAERAIRLLRNARDMGAA